MTVEERSYSATEVCAAVGCNRSQLCRWLTRRMGLPVTGPGGPVRWLTAAEVETVDMLARASAAGLSAFFDDIVVWSRYRHGDDFTVYPAPGVSVTVAFRPITSIGNLAATREPSSC